MHESDSKKFKKVKFDVTPASENYDAQTSEQEAEEFQLVGSSRVKRTKERLESLIHENAKSVSPLNKSSYGKKSSYGPGAVVPVPRIPAKYLLGNASSRAPHTCDADTENMASLTENAVARAKAPARRTDLSRKSERRLCSHCCFKAHEDGSSFLPLILSSWERFVRYLENRED